ncbi:hypothetical protein, partial [Vibrio parahaemolyticus]|uniref:hypothetical protein n=1 Tax=Vibrio parahaemolyticus TaxID=670 RepID=UPI00301DDFB2
TGARKSKTADTAAVEKEQKSSPELDPASDAKACLMAESQIGRYKDPFAKKNLEIKDDVVYCLGNNTLCYLNLSYNNLSYP